LKSEAGIPPGCAECGEPVELYEPGDPDSWIHAADANYWGDHTAWVKPDEDASEIQQKSSSWTKNGVKQRHRSTTKNGL
jgi:hypothetical protein